MSFVSKKRFPFCFGVLVATIACFSIFTYYHVSSVVDKYKNCDYIVKIFNGLGNQLFEYSFGYILEKQTNKKNCYDLSFFEIPEQQREKHEIFMLDKFNVDMKNVVVFDRKDNKWLFALKQKFYVIWNFDNAFRFDKEENLLFDNRRKVFTYNYFSEKYFNKYKQDLLKLFKIAVSLNEKNQKMLKEIKKHKNSVSIHIRRGDYQKYSEYRDVVNIDNYYKKALKVFDNMQDVHYFVFSNDTKWAKENLKTNKPTTYVDINSETDAYFDFELMRNCQHHINSHSTFSYWASYLSNNEDGIVVAPKKLNNNANEQNRRKSLNLKGWKIIDNE